MTFTLLLDLDDTLLNTNLEAFVPAYFQAISQHLQSRLDRDKITHALVAGMAAMNSNEDPRRTLKDVFEAEFGSQLDLESDSVGEPLSEFIQQVFPTLAGHTSQNDEAIRFVDWALASGFRVAIATDPFFYQAATEQRLRWAGFDPGRFTLISSADHFHFTKSHPAYYAELLGRLGWQEGPVLMAGNDVQRDIIPARRLGLQTFLVEAGSGSSVNSETGRGTFDELRAWIESADPLDFEPSFKTRDGILGIASSTPAVLYDMCRSLDAEQWRHEPTRDDWAMTEILCHLRDTDREVHSMQLDLMIDKPDAFIPRPDTGVWASEREYLSEDGALAMAEFAEARIGLLGRLKPLPVDLWKRKARHAIFGPTDFLEIMSFLADHDRLHLQQAWKTMQSLRVGASI